MNREQYTAEQIAAAERFADELGTQYSSREEIIERRLKLISVIPKCLPTNKISHDLKKAGKLHKFDNIERCRCSECNN